MKNFRLPIALAALFSFAAQAQVVLPGTPLGGGGIGTPASPTAVTGTGAAGQVTFWTGAQTIDGDPTLLWDSAATLFTVTGRQLITGGTLTAGQEALRLTATLPNTAAGDEIGVEERITSAGTGAGTATGHYTVLLAGYAGSGTTYASGAASAAASTGTNLQTSGGNFSFYGITLGAGAGHNAGAYASASGSTALNVGALNTATGATAADAYGVVGTVQFSGSGNQIAGAFGTWTNSKDLTTLPSSVIYGSNDVDAISLFTLQDNTTTVFEVADGGALTQDGGAVFNEAGANVNFRIEGDARANLFFVDADGGTDGRIGVNTATPGATVDIDNLAVSESPLTVRANGTAVMTVGAAGGLAVTGGDIITTRATTVNLYSYNTSIGDGYAGTTAVATTGSGAIHLEMRASSSGKTGTMFGLANASAADLFVDTGEPISTMRIGTVGDKALVFGENNEERLRLGVSTEHRVSITGSTLTTQKYALSTTATLPNPGSTDEVGNSFVATSAGAGNSGQVSLFSSLAAGYTGSGNTWASIANNFALGTAANALSGTVKANYGQATTSQGTTTGDRVGQYVLASGGNRDFGLVALTQNSKSAATHVAIYGNAENAGGGGAVSIAGLFTLGSSASDPALTQQAALIADNRAVASSPFVVRDNGTTKFEIVDNGNAQFSARILADSGTALEHTILAGDVFSGDTVLTIGSNTTDPTPADGVIFTKFGYNCTIAGGCTSAGDIHYNAVKGILDGAEISMPYVLTTAVQMGRAGSPYIGTSSGSLYDCVSTTLGDMVVRADTDDSGANSASALCFCGKDTLGTTYTWVNLTPTASIGCGAN